MSHLIHVVELKEQLTAAGVPCPLKQAELLREPFTRAITRFFYQKHTVYTEAFERAVWKQLEKWNNISPIPAQGIVACFKLRYNLLRNALMQTGALPHTEEFSTYAVLENGSKVDISELPAFNTLVSYLVKELENCDE